MVGYPAKTMPRAKFPDFSVDLPFGWGDITAELDNDDPPATVARGDGVGALQFSIALYESGPRPTGDVKELQELLDGFAETHELTSRSNAIQESLPRGLVAASFQPNGDFLRVWYVGEGPNFAFVTYTCERSLIDARELAEAEQIVRSVVFGDPAAG
jgi:hypothetical protein